MDEKRICSECGTENEEKFEFCKNCGKALESEEAQQNTYAENAAYSASFGQYANGYNSYMNIPEIEGIPTDEVAAFVGGKAAKIIPKFAKMQVTASKTSWCWPAAILGFLFGPIGAAFWYLYRKMYKIAIIFMAIGIILSVAGSFVSSFVLSEQEKGSAYEDIYDALNAYVNGEITLEEYTDAVTDSMNSGASGTIENISGVATLIVAGLLSYHWYKKHMVKSIMKVRAVNTDPRYYHFALSASGGTSGGAVILGIVIYYGIIAAASGILMFVAGALF